MKRNFAVDTIVRFNSTGLERIDGYALLELVEMVGGGTRIVKLDEYKTKEEAEAVRDALQ